LLIGVSRFVVGIFHPLAHNWPRAWLHPTCQMNFDVHMSVHRKYRVILSLEAPNYSLYAEHRQMQVTGRVQYIAGGPCCFSSLPVCVYKFSSHYLNNIIFIDNSLGPLARESPRISLKYDQQVATCSRSIYFYKLLYMFQAVPPPNIRSTKRYIQHQVLSNQ
jgi:hypothetical protein